MSKLRKSELSPSITQGSNAIDLGKNSGVDMGQKSQPSITSGGIGVTQEVTSIGGMSVTGGVSVDIAPLNFGITANPSEGFISVAGGAEVPGGLIGISGGVTIDTNTGEIIGGSIGGEVGGLGINISNSEKGGLGIEFTVQIPGTPIELSLGFGFPPKEPTPTIAPTSNGIDDPVIFPTGSDRYCCIALDSQGYTISTFDTFPHNEHREWSAKVIGKASNFNPQHPAWKMEGTNVYYEKNKITGAVYNYYKTTETYNISSYGSSDYRHNGEYIGTNGRVIVGKESAIYGYLASKMNSSHPTMWAYAWSHTRAGKVRFSVADGICYPNNTPEPLYTPNNSSPPPPLPFPNPPPRRRNKMDECCRVAIALTRANRRFLQEILLMLGRPLNAQGNLTSPPKTNFFGEPVERIQTPIGEKQEKETIVFNNYYELLMYGLKQQINLDVAIDPQSFAIPTGKLQNPNYQRDSEQSLENNVQPEEDKKGNKRELELGIDVRINSISQQQQYLFEAVKRLEYLFPAGELADARFEKSLIIPGATGELQIHNLIHFKEFLIQFLNATLGNPKIPVKIEDNNALKKGNQKATFDHFSMSQMIRELYRVVLESGDDINSIMEIAVRNFRTSLANRMQVVQTAEMVQALVEDTGMLENQEFIPLKLEGDPYAGKWKPGVGFEPDEDLDSNEEAATERLMQATLKNFEAQVKVIRRDKKENADIRDLLLQLAEMFIRSTAIPATKEGIEKALAAGRFKVKVDNAISRSQVKRAAAAKLSRTKKRKK